MPCRLFFDVATSRFHADKATGEEPRVLRIVWQRDDQPEPVFRLIKPKPDTTVDPSTFPYHGLSIEMMEHGSVEPSIVVAELERAAHDARSIVSFFQEFHWRHLHRLMGHVGAPIPTTAVCAMELAKPILALPLMRPGGGIKPPSLREACAFFNIEPPVQDGSPEERAISTVRAVRGVFEACLTEIPPRAA